MEQSHLEGAEPDVMKTSTAQGCKTVAVVEVVFAAAVVAAECDCNKACQAEEACSAVWVTAILTDFEPNLHCKGLSVQAGTRNTTIVAESSAEEADEQNR
jgi:hypothetical protein